MKHSILELRLLAAVVAAGLLGTFALMAADPAPAAEAAGDRAARQGRGGMLDDQQRQVFREALQRDNAKLQSLDQKLQAAQRALMEAVLAETYDEAAVQEKAETLARLQAQMMIVRGKALNSVAPTLTPEQKQQLLSSRFGASMLSGGLGVMEAGVAAGMGPGGGRGGQGGRGQGRGAR